LSCVIQEKFQSPLSSKKKEAQSKKLCASPNILDGNENYAENEVPHPHPPVAFGFSNVKPEPIIFDA
jgi:hypothetical protein